MEERKGAITFMKNPMTLIGPEVKVGDKAKDFEATKKDLSDFFLCELKGKTVVISFVNSIFCLFL